MPDDIQNGWGAQALDVESLNRNTDSGVMSGCDVSTGTNALEIDVASGAVLVAASKYDISATTVTLSSGDSNPRKDIIYVDDTGSVAVAEGTPNPAAPGGETGRDTRLPIPPDLSGIAAVPLAEIWVPENASDVSQSDISDRSQDANRTVGTLDVEHDLSVGETNTFTVNSGTGDVSVTDGDFLLANGFRIKDTTGTSRMYIADLSTQWYNDEGDKVIDANGSDFTRHVTYADEPLQVYNPTNSHIVAEFLDSGNVGVPNGQLSEQGNRVATRTWVDSNADVPNADYADTAGDADTLDGVQLADISFSDTAMTRYSDNEARSALQSASRVGGSDLFFDFDNNSSYIELVNGSGTRKELVASDLYVGDGSGWLGDYNFGDMATGGYDLQKNGSDTSGVINFKT
jgi:hypothetical protein